jgi:hypothetical protein
MPAPLAKGLIIAASVIVAAGIAIYESPQVRQWVDQSRRKLAVALHTLGDEIQPRRNSETSLDPEANKRRRQEIVRRNRNELIRRAREEGIAVDLDELARIGREEARTKDTPCAATHEKSRSFDELIGTDGKLKDEDSTAQKTTALDSSDDGLRRRGPGLGGFFTGSVVANPFEDDESQVMFDRDLAAPGADEAPSPNPFHYLETRESTATLEGVPTGQLIDLTPDAAQEEADLLQAINNSLESSRLEEHASENASQAQSFHSFYSADSLDSAHYQDQSSTMPAEENYDSEPEHLSTGTLTPRSDGFSTNASVVGSHADDIAILSMQNDDDHDARSEAFSEGGFSEFGEGDRRGVMTPNSWTDVGSDDESDFGGTGLQGTQQWGQSTIQKTQ